MSSCRWRHFETRSLPSPRSEDGRRAVVHQNVDFSQRGATKSFTSIEEISDEEWELTLATNVSAMFYITKAAIPHMNKGSSIINTASINADKSEPPPSRLHTRDPEFYRWIGTVSRRKGSPRECHCARSGMDASAMPPEKITHCGEQVPMKRPAQPKEPAPVYVMLATEVVLAAATWAAAFMAAVLAAVSTAALPMAASAATAGTAGTWGGWGWGYPYCWGCYWGNPYCGYGYPGYAYYGYPYGYRYPYW
jgi:Enoyl-(Acyl carrier protein) reductase